MLTSLIENMNDSVIVLDDQNRIAYFNAAAQQLVEDAASPSQPSAIEAALIQRFDLLTRYQHITTQVSDTISIGTKFPRYFDVRITPLRDDHQTITQRMIVLRDITALKKLQVQILEQAEQVDQLNTETQHHLKELEAIQALSQASASQLELNNLLELVGEKLKQVFSVQAVFVAFYNEKEGLISLPYWIVYEDHLTADPIIFGHGLSTTIIKTRQPLIINNNYQQRSSELNVQRVSNPRGALPKSWMGVPMIVGEEVIGVLSIQDYERENVFTASTVRVLSTIADNLGIAIKNSQLYEAEQQQSIKLREANALLLKQITEIEILQAKLRQQAIRDPLTNLFNRRYLTEILEIELPRATREAQPLGMLIADVDFFKKINDTYGHKAGDLVLQALADLLMNNVGEGETVYRYGGEEFLILLPATPLHAAYQRAEKLRQKFAALRVPHKGHQIQATMSLGVASFPTHGSNDDELLQAADKALYVAKNSGRNCVKIAVQSAPLS